MNFPEVRMRRLRRNQSIRSLIQETVLNENDLIYPLFVVPGKDIQEPIVSMPGQYRWSVDRLIPFLKEDWAKNLRGILLFGIPEYKDAQGSSSWDEANPVQRACRAIKEEGLDLIIFTDVCFCEYTTHGHCGIYRDGDVDNDATLELLGKQAISHARAGADFVAPSDMMDGRVGVIRKALDQEGYSGVGIMAYSAKFCSAFYGPFRDAADSAPQSGDRQSYQMNPANAREALREMELDIQEGADIIMVKPALSYLDIIRKARDNFLHPIAAYNVSGEYSMVKLAAERGLIDERRVVLEILTAIKRAGADLIISYHTPEVIKWLKR